MTLNELNNLTAEEKKAAAMNMIDRIEAGGFPSREELTWLIANQDSIDTEVLFAKARAAREPYYGKNVYLRGLIEFTNYCKNNCHYCGIRAANKNAVRYRLNTEQILDCCEVGYQLGFRTFVLQGGEDLYFTPERIADIVKQIRERFPDCAITLSIGEYPREVYEMWYKAGANRYLLRHETANHDLYAQLHPAALSLDNRMRCLKDLKEIGYQTGSGFMVGAPGQTPEALADDLIYLKELKPEMIGIGPFIPHHDTEYAKEPAGKLSDVLFLLAILRLMFPDVLLPATTALGTISPTGREQGLNAGANVIMPNLSPSDVRKNYLLYDNKICTGDEAAEQRRELEKRIEKAGYKVSEGRGDHVSHWGRALFTLFESIRNVPPDSRLTHIMEVNYEFKFYTLCRPDPYRYLRPQKCR